MSSDTHENTDIITILADRQRCVGAGTCWQLAPHLFDQDDEVGLVELVSPNPTVADLAVAQDVEGACPSGAITVRRG